MPSAKRLLPCCARQSEHGQRVLAFETAFQDTLAAPMPSGELGTAGLHLCVRAAGIQDGTW